MRSEVVCKENRIQYKLKNSQKHEIAKIKVDGGVFPPVASKTHEHKKCDFLLVNCDQLFGILVELKGTDCSTAIKQITDTLDLIKNTLIQHQLMQVHARVAMRSTKHVDKVSNERMKLDRKLKTGFGGGSLKIAKSPFIDSM
ncbi:MAG: hypothetical protein FWD31_07705 [Planctomycetaceae bacterium]|nr:hypothetical protein [Planctomycetaceae bacterium]